MSIQRIVHCFSFKDNPSPPQNYEPVRGALEASLAALLARSAASLSSIIANSTSSFKILSSIKAAYWASVIGVTGLHLESSQLDFGFAFGSAAASPEGILLRTACPLAPKMEKMAMAGRMFRGPPGHVSGILAHRQTDRQTKREREREREKPTQHTADKTGRGSGNGASLDLVGRGDLVIAAPFCDDGAPCAWTCVRC